MNSRLEKIGRRALVLLACLAAGGAWACSAVAVRGQVTLVGQFGLQQGRLPQEVAMQTGDLLSVLAPRGATATLMVPGEGPTEPVVTLDAERYRALSAQGRGVVPVEVRSDSLPRNRQWQHFGASAPGVVYLKLTWGQKQALVRVQVAERPVVPRGTQLVWSEARQQDTIHLTQFDTLTLDLPGEPGDGWQITMQSGKSVLRSVAAAEGVVAGRVLLRVDVKPGAPEDVLSIQRQGRELFRFSVRPRPVPAC